MADLQQKILELRRDYQGTELTEKSMPSTPSVKFEQWLTEAINSELLEPTAMTLATVDASGRPSVRTVLCGGFTDAGFVFHTNYRSRKGNDMEHNAHVALLFFWRELSRQVHLEGVAEKLSAAESDAYFETRPRERHIAAWAAIQSSHLKNREQLIESYKKLEEEYADMPVPRPPHWGGYRVKPERIEFWQGRPNRLHDRLVYELQNDGSWQLSRLAP